MDKDNTASDRVSVCSNISKSMPCIHRISSVRTCRSSKSGYNARIPDTAVSRML